MTVRILDVVSGDLHDLPASTPCVRCVDFGSRYDAVDLPARYAHRVIPIANLLPGDEAYVRSEDPGESDGAVTWWLSRRVGAHR